MIEVQPITKGDAAPPIDATNPYIYLLNTVQVDHYWPRIEAELEAQPELWNGWWTLEAIRNGTLDETIQVWVVSKSEKIRAVFMTQIIIAPAGKILQVFWIRGDLPEGSIKSISLALEHFGEHHSCFRIVVFGRPGWGRKLRSIGALPDGIILTRPITKKMRN